MAIDLEKYRKGDEFSGRKIADIVGRNGHFMICTVELPKGLGIQWGTAEDYPFSPRQHVQLAAFNARYDLVKKLFPAESGPVEALALDLFQGLSVPDNDPEVTFKGIDALIASGKEKASSRTRVVYGISAAVIAVVLGTIFLLLAFQINPDEAIAKLPQATLLLCAAVGAVGALASVLQKLRQVEVSHYPGFFTAAFGGCSRIILGLIFGMVAFTAAKSGLVLSALLETPGGDLLIAFAGGISERFVPELIKTLETQSPAELSRPPIERRVGRWRGPGFE